MREYVCIDEEEIPHVQLETIMMFCVLDYYLRITHADGHLLNLYKAQQQEEKKIY